MRFTLPEVKTCGAVADALAAVLKAMAEGTLTADEASAVAAVIETQRRALETEQLEVRMTAIEAQLTHAQTN